MFKELKLHQKVIIGMVMTSLLAITMIVMLSFVHLQRFVSIQTFSHLQTIRELKKVQIEDYFKTLTHQLQILCTDPFVTSAYQTITRSDTAGMAFGNVSENQIRERFSYILTHNGWEKIYLIQSDNGEYQTLFSASQEPEITTSNEISDSEVSKLITKIRNNSENEAAFSDIVPAPVSREPVHLMAGKIQNHDETIGYVVVQMSSGNINDIMQQRQGLGKTGDAYLVGPDKLLRADTSSGSVKISFANPADKSMDTAPAKEALAGRTGEQIVLEHSGMPVFSAYTPVKAGDINWALIIEISKREALVFLQQYQYMTIAASLSAVMIIVVIAFFLARLIKVHLDAPDALASLPRKEQIEKLEALMIEAAGAMEFEKAAYYRDKVRRLKGQAVM